MPTFRVQEVGPDEAVVREETLVAASAVDAASEVLGVELVRGSGYAGAKLRAKVYRVWRDGNPPTLVRLYDRKHVE